MPFFSIKIPESYEKTERLDKYIAALPGGMNRSKLKSGVTNILVNGKKQKVSYKVKAGDQINVEWEDNIPEDIEPEDIPLDIIYEDENVCVVNKKQGMVTHPACGNWNGTLVNALLYHWGRQKIPQIMNGKPSEILERRRPGIVHRLDKDTSGIIITAKNRESEEWLQSQFQRHGCITKEYIAICTGRPQHRHGVIETNMIRDPKNRKRFKAVPLSEEGKYAKTYYKAVSCYGEYTLMVLRIATGRTHQIRVHMKYLNCPVLGDKIYSKQDKLFPDAELMLNARMLKIRLPSQSGRSTFRTATPERFKEVMKVLKKKYPKTILPKDR